MSRTAVVKLDIDDSKLKLVTKQLVENEKKLQAMPGQWGKVGQSIGKVTGAGEKFVKAVAKTSEQFLNANTATQKLVIGLKAADRTVSSLGRGTMTVARNLKDATKSLLSWAGVMGLISGVLGAGGLFGITRMAESVSTGQTQSKRTGSTYGEEKAASIAYGNLINVQSVLEQINRARQSGGLINGKPVFQQAGLKNTDWQGKSSAEILPKYLEAIQNKFTELSKKSGGLQGLASGATGLEDIVDFGTLTQLANMRNGELETMQSIYQARKKELDLSEGTQNAWANFSKQLQAAGEKLENVFVKSLVTLTPALGKFSEAMVNAVGNLMKSGFVKNLVSGAGKELNKVSTYLSSDEFSQDLKNFLTELQKIGDTMLNIAHFMEKWFGSEPKFAANPSVEVVKQITNEALHKGENKTITDDPLNNKSLMSNGRSSQSPKTEAKQFRERPQTSLDLNIMNGAGTNLIYQTYAGSTLAS